MRDGSYYPGKWMFNLPSELAVRDEPIRTGVVGAGLFGTNLIGQLERTTGLEATVVADVRTDKPVKTLTDAGVPSADVEVVDGPDEANDVIADGRRPVLADGEQVAETDVDVVVEATGAPEYAAKHADAAIRAGKHVVMATVEVDTVVGPYLADLAADCGVTYSMAYGDQPSLIIELCEWAEMTGLDVVAAGKGTLFREEYRYGTPDDIFDRLGFSDDFVAEHDLNPRIYNWSVDGTKAAIEICAVANAFDLEPDVPGMHTPTAEIPEIPETLRPEVDGGILNGTGIVDTVNTLYADGSSIRRDRDITHGVFVVTTTSTERVQRYLGQVRETGLYTANDGKYQLFYRPYHLPGLETTLSVASAALRNRATGVIHEQTTEVVAGAKRDIEAGSALDGAYSIYGKLVDADVAANRDYVPFEMITDATLANAVETDDILTYDDVVLDDDSVLYRLRREQESAT